MKVRVETERKCIQESTLVNPDERWSDRTPAIYDPSVLGVYKDDDGQFEVSDSATDVWVVWTSYTDGDTFGYTSGYLQVVEVFETYEEAEPFAKAIRALDRSNRLGSDSDLLKDYYISGTGYFASLDDVYVEHFEVEFNPAVVAGTRKVRF